MKSRFSQMQTDWDVLGVYVLLAFFCAAPVRAQVTPQRLVDAAKEPQNWLTYSGDYAGRHPALLRTRESRAGDSRRQSVHGHDGLPRDRPGCEDRQRGVGCERV